MRPASRDEQLRILNAAAGSQPDEATEAWAAVLALYQLPVKWVPGMQIALAEGSYRNADHPAAYALTVARNAGRRLRCDQPTKDAPIVAPLKIPASFKPRDSTAGRHDAFIDNACYEAEKGVYGYDGDDIPTVAEVFQNEDGCVDWVMVGYVVKLTAEQVAILQARADGHTREGMPYALRARGLALTPKQVAAAWKAIERKKPEIASWLRGQKPGKADQPPPRADFRSSTVPSIPVPPLKQNVPKNGK